MLLTMTTHNFTMISNVAEPECERILESERKRIAKDLHDDLGSQLTAIKMALARLNAQLPAAGSRQLRSHLLEADRLIDGAIDAMHDIIDDLHPPVLDLGLRAGLEWLSNTLSSQSGVPIHLFPGEDLPPSLLDTFQTVSLYRITREALHNISKHAAASQVEIRLQQNDLSLTLEISDNGVGLPDHAGSLPATAGLRNMRARAAAIGAVLTLSPAGASGTRVLVELSVIPLPNPIK